MISRNPDWTEDELIIALDFYFRTKGKSADWVSAEAKVVSERLGELDIHKTSERNEKFRDPPGVLRRFRYFDALANGRPIDGRANYRAVWNKFGASPDELRKAMDTIELQQGTVELQSLRGLFDSVVEGWADYKATGKVDSKSELYAAVIKEIPNQLALYAGDSSSRYKIEGSTGKGNVTAAPWVAVFDKSITTSATTGFYPVYLFSTDLERLYLCIGFGAQQFIDTFGIAKGHKKIRQAVQKVKAFFADKIDSANDISDMDLAPEGSKLHKGYQDGTIYCWASYETTELPDDSRLAADFRAAIEFYQAMILDPLMPSIEELVVSAVSVEDTKVTKVSVSRKKFVARPRKKRAAGKKGTTSGLPRRSKQAQKTGRAGEDIVFESEINKLIDLGLPHLAEKVRPHFKLGETPGWDLTSFDEHGNEMFIEVKSTVSKKISSIDITRNEWRAATDKSTGGRYYLFLVTGVFSKKVEIEELENPAELVKKGKLSVSPSVFELSLFDVD